MDAPEAHVVTPSGPARPEDLARGLELLGRWGIPASVTPMPALPPALAPVYLAAPDAARAAQLRAALGAAGGDAQGASARAAVWMARGGYGAARTLEAAGEGLFRDAPPAPLWGFSDGTALLAAWDRAGWPAWLAPPITQLPRLDAPSARRVRAAWREGRVDPFEGLRPLRAGVARGPLGGGNLCLLASLVGTPWAAALRGRVVVVEDVGEVPYKVDRLLTQLRQAGALEGVAGLVVGEFTGVSAAQVAEIEALVARQADDLGVPAAAGLPVGHGARNAPLPVGPATGYAATLEVPVGGGAAGGARLVVERTP